MVKYQLYSKIPPIDLVKDIIKLYGINDFDEHYYFSLKDLEENNIIEHIKPFNIILQGYYRKCKWSYITDVTLKKTITILRQLTRIYNYKVVSKEKFTHGIKIILYNIKSINHTIEPKVLTLKFE